MTDAHIEPPELTRVWLRGGRHTVIAAAVADVTTWMQEGGAYHVRFVYWQTEDSDRYDPEVPMYEETAGALRAADIIQAEEIDPRIAAKVAMARAVQAREG